MKIFIVTDYFWPSIGGLENSTAYLTKALQKYFAVEILTIIPITSFKENTSLPIRRFSTNNGAPYQAMKEYIASQKSPKAICFFGFSNEWTDDHLNFVADSRRELAEKVIFKIPSLNEFSLYINNTDRKAKIQAVDKFICTNHAILDELIQTEIPKEKLIFQPNGIPCDTFIPPTSSQKKVFREKFNLSERLTFIFTGRFAARKRVDLLVEAFNRVPGVNLVLVGYFDNRFDEGSTFTIPENGRIYKFGPVYDVLPFLQASDIFVSASIAEGMPNSMLESLSCGLPALVTMIPGHQEVIQPVINGKFFEPNNIDDLCKQIHWFVQHQEKLTILSKAARETVLARFNIQSVAETYFHLLTGVNNS